MHSHISLRQLFLSHNAQTSLFPLLLEFERAEGVYLYNKDGKSWIDLIAGIGVSSLGHGRPEIKQAITEQVDRYLHLMVYGEYVLAPQVLFAQKLTQLLDPSLNCVYFVNSGTEAVEGAMKLAKRYTGRQQIFAFNHSYHGSTQGALSVMGNEEFKSAFRPLLPQINFLDLNNHDQLLLINESTACVILETIQGEAGVRIPSFTYMVELRKRCSATGTLLILDEIQCGMGRTGKLFAFEHYGIIPDILLLAKSLGGGMPLGAFISSNKIMSALSENPVLGHITSFGGHPVCCAAAIAALEILIRENLTSFVEEKSQLFASLLTHQKIKQIRRKGLMIAIEFENFKENKVIIDRCIAKGVIVDWFLHDSSSMRICPPLSISTDQIKEACAIILDSISESI